MQIGYFMGVLSKYVFIYNLEHKFSRGEKQGPSLAPAERDCVKAK